MKQSKINLPPSFGISQSKLYIYIGSKFTRRKAIEINFLRVSFQETGRLCASFPAFMIIEHVRNVCVCFFFIILFVLFSLHSVFFVLKITKKLNRFKLIPKYRLTPSVYRCLYYLQSVTSYNIYVMLQHHV